MDFVEEREQSILNILDEKKRITVPELAEFFNLSESAIRKQLNALEKKGRLIRTHGGAISMDEASFEEPLEEKSINMIKEKKAIARASRKYINDGDIIILGGGTTVLELAKLLHDLKNSIVITNSILIAVELYKNTNIEVRISGGTIREKTCSLVGPQAEKYFDGAFVDKTFIGADAISFEYGLTTPNSLEAEVEKLIIKHGKTVYVLADHTKMEKITLVKEASLDEINYIISDENLNRDFIARFKETGISVVIA